MGEQLRSVLEAIAAERSDPVGRHTMLLASGGPRDLPVGHIADEEMEERVFGLPADR